MIGDFRSTCRWVLMFGILVMGFWIGAYGIPEQSEAFDSLLSPPADWILIHGRVYPLWPEPDHRVPALAIRDGRIAAVGDDTTLLAQWRGPHTRVTDLQGRTVLPGLTDAHVHLAGLGRRLRQLDLVGTRSKEEILQKVQVYARKHPEMRWIVGRGWDQNDWPDPRMPDRADLDRVVPDRPVFLTRIDGHAAWVNSRALELAGITRDTPDPPGGRILRRSDGSPTGVLIDRAVGLVRAVMPEPTIEDIRRDLEAGARACVAAGLTSIHDAGIDTRTWQAYLHLLQEGRLPLRVYAMAMYGSDLAETLLRTGPIIGLGEDRLTLRAIKVIADGALGSRGAALLEPYTDEPDSRGLLLVRPEELETLSRRALRAGVQLAVHAIGDRANRMVLDVWERVFGPRGCPSCRFRIEHAQIIHPDDIPRFAQLHVIPSMQPTHATSDMPWVPARLGPHRQRGAYAWRSLLDTGVVIAGGSDAPVEEIFPMLGLYAATTRQDRNGQPPGGWHPEQRVTPLEAVQMFTTWAAYAAFMEDLVGRLRPGMFADFTVLDRDPMDVNPREIPRIHVHMTVIGGNVVYTRQE